MGIKYELAVKIVNKQEQFLDTENHSDNFLSLQLTGGKNGNTL